LKKEWEESVHARSVTLTWPHSHVLLSKSDVEDKVLKVLSQRNYSAFDNIIFLKINGQKNSLKLMKDFGFLPAGAGLNGGLTQYNGIWNERRSDDICANATMHLFDKFWFDNDITDNLTKPFKFAGGCMVPPNQLVIKYVSTPPIQSGASDAKEKEEGDGAVTLVARSVT